MVNHSVIGWDPCIILQVAGGAGFSTSPQTRPAKLLFVAYTAQQQNFSGLTLNSLLKPTDTEQTRENPHGFFFLIGRSRETWLSPPARCHHSWHLRPATPTHLTPKSPSDRPLPITGHLLAPPTTKSLEGRPRRPASTLPLLRPVRRRRGDA